jgi:hypothetical protein
MIAVSVQPSSHPGQSDFPSPVGGDSFSQDFFLGDGRLKCSLTYTLILPSYKSHFAVRWLYRDSPALHPVALLRGSHCPPRAPLRAAALPLLPCAQGTGRRELPRLLRSYWLMRQTVILPKASVFPTLSSLCRSLTSPCCITAFPDVISAILVWSSGSIPRHDPAVLVRCFPRNSGLAQGSNGLAHGIFPQRSFMRGEISGLQPFVNLQTS